MNKKLISIAVASVFAMPMVASAETESKAYASLHVAGEMVDMGGDTDPEYRIDGGARKGSRIGMKGSMDTSLMDFKAVAQIEVGLNQGKAGAGSVYERDSWVGLSSKSLGTVRGGTMATSYKQSGSMVDPLFQTALEGRGFMNTMSATLHAGTGEGYGRSTHTVRYDSPEMAGAKVIVDYNFNPLKEDNIGLGIHWKGGPAMAFFDMQMIGEGNLVDAKARPKGIVDKNGKADSGTAMKIGGKYSMGAIDISGQYEIDGGAVSGNSDGEQNKLYAAVAYKMGATVIVGTFGMSAETMSDAKDDNTGFGLAVVQMLDKKTKVYAGWGMASGGDKFNSGESINAMAVGMDMYF